MSKIASFLMSESMLSMFLLSEIISSGRELMVTGESEKTLLVSAELLNPAGLLWGEEREASSKLGSVQLGSAMWQLAFTAADGSTGP